VFDLTFIGISPHEQNNNFKIDLAMGQSNSIDKSSGSVSSDGDDKPVSGISLAPDLEGMKYCEASYFLAFSFL
jgi:hypothetical protein